MSGGARAASPQTPPLPLQEDEAKVAAAEEKAAAAKAASEERAAEAAAAAAAPRYVPADEVTLARLSAIARASALAVAAGHGNAAAAEAAAAALAEAQTKGVLVQPDPATVAAAAAAALAGGGGGKKSAAAAAADARSNVDMARDFAAVISRQLGITEGAAGTPTGAWGCQAGGGLLRCCAEPLVPVSPPHCPLAGGSYEELEINDYPSKAIKRLHRELNMIRESYNVQVCGGGRGGE